MNKDKVIFTTGVLIGLVIVGASGFLYYKKQLIVNSEKLTVKTTTQTQTTNPTQKPQETIDFDEKSDYKNTDIQVLNGSGKAGLAKVYADKLIELGYLKITTANYTETINGNLLFAPTDFGKEINLENYKYEKSEEIKIVIGI